MNPHKQKDYRRNRFVGKDQELALHRELCFPWSTLELMPCREQDKQIMEIRNVTWANAMNSGINLWMIISAIRNDGTPRKRMVQQGRRGSRVCNLQVSVFAPLLHPLGPTSRFSRCYGDWFHALVYGYCTGANWQGLSSALELLTDTGASLLAAGTLSGTTLCSHTPDREV